ncbi:protein cueball isoform X2 [Anopheles gambiae]|uniref:protein cueball isoform X2 n=1 Tax=Anopheles gambiae TaxID=7165 RepID=UPI002AC9D0AF|nr:protein cueball isoform X2 [Anopheles gambiae]
MKSPCRAAAGWLVLLLSSCCLGYVIATEWAAAVTTDNGILFFDSNWRKISSAAHQYSRISAFAYDEVLGKLYFADLDHPEYRLFALDYDDTDELHKVTKLLPKSAQTAYISGMAFDHLERRLYWTEKGTRSVYYVAIDDLLSSTRSAAAAANGTAAAAATAVEATTSASPPSSSSPVQLVATVQPDHELAGLAIDECRRHLYWTNCYPKTSNIVRAAMNGTVLNVHEEQVYLPKGITVDHYRNRLYWVEKKYGRRYTIESADLEVNDQRTLQTGLDRLPADIAVKNDYIYWTDQENNEIYEMSKEPNAPSRTVYRGEHPSAVILRANLLLEHQRNNPDCRSVVDRILENMQNSKPASVLQQETLQQGQLTVCLNNGTVNHHTNACLCQPAFGGKLCEIDLCNNYCAQGSCRIGRDNRPRCDCDRRYEGDRCDRNRCDGFCLNGGRCQFSNGTGGRTVEEMGDRTCLCESTGYSGARCENPICGTDYCYNGECYVEDGKRPKCRCKAGYRGERCEEYSCNNYCLNGGHCTLGNETTVPECECGEEFAGQRCEIAVRLCSTYNEDPQWQQYCLGISKTLPLMEPKVTYCKESFNRTVVYTSLCFTVSFALLLAVVLVVSRMMKPPRPRITKKMVVTPMTSRPPTTQCEITIENCCNMNVCETPCFDTKLLKKSKKEDKQFLLEDIEDVGGSYRKLPNCGDGTAERK